MSSKDRIDVEYSHSAGPDAGFGTETVVLVDSDGNEYETTITRDFWGDGREDRIQDNIDAGKYTRRD